MSILLGAGTQRWTPQRRRSPASRPRELSPPPGIPPAPPRSRRCAGRASLSRRGPARRPYPPAPDETAAYAQGVRAGVTVGQHDFISIPASLDAPGEPQRNPALDAPTTSFSSESPLSPPPGIPPAPPRSRRCGSGFSIPPWSCEKGTRPCRLCPGRPRRCCRWTTGPAGSSAQDAPAPGVRRGRGRAPRRGDGSKLA